MNTDDLQVLVHRADGVEGRPAVRLDEVRDRIRTARRRRAAAAAVGAVAAVLAVLVGTTLVSDPKGRSQDPVKPTPSPSETFRIPAGQVTLHPDIGPGDVRGWETLGTRTNRDPGFKGATDLSMTVTLHTQIDGGGATVAWFCHGDPDTWFVMVYDNGGGTVAPCRRDRPAAPPPPPDLQAFTRASAPGELPVRMYVTATPPKGERDCLSRAYRPKCDTLLPLSSTDAEFGFTVYEHRPSRHVLEVLGWPFEALAVVEGEEYLVDRAVVAAPRATRLVVRLGASDRPRVVSLYRAETPALEACGGRLDKDGILDGMPYKQAEFERLQRQIQAQCVVRLVSRVDSRRVRGPGQAPSYGEEWRTTVAPGPAREVTVDVAANDPRNTRFAVIVWRGRQ